MELIQDLIMELHQDPIMGIKQDLIMELHQDPIMGNKQDLIMITPAGLPLIMDLHQ